ELRFRFAFRKEGITYAEDLAVEGGVERGVVGGVPAPPPPPPPMVQANMVTRRETDQAETVSAPQEVTLRSDFSETAFWQPHLLTGPDGTASIEFTAPDSVTSWSFWLHAVTRDLRAGSLETEVRSVKDLMVRPYLPRFL